MDQRSKITCCCCPPRRPTPQPPAIAINHEVQIYPRGRQRRRVHVRRGLATRICSRWRLIRPHVVANECYTRMLAIVVSTILSGVGIHCFGRYQLILQYNHILFVLLTYQPYNSIEPLWLLFLFIRRIAYVHFVGGNKWPTSTRYMQQIVCQGRIWWHYSSKEVGIGIHCWIIPWTYVLLQRFWVRARLYVLFCVICRLCRCG